MARKIKEIRREELLNAALETLKEVGIANTTVALVSQAAGMAPGMVHHYFKNKNALIEGALRFANTKRREEILAATRTLDDPKQRLFKIVEVNFWESRFNVGTTRMWITFCAEVPFNPGFSRIQRVLHRRLHSNLKYNLRMLLDDEDEIEKAAYGLSNLIDGLWLQAAVQEEKIDSNRAMETAEDYLARFGIHREQS